jgi:hypothetical protein
LKLALAVGGGDCSFGGSINDSCGGDGGNQF